MLNQRTPLPLRFSLKKKLSNTENQKSTSNFTFLWFLCKKYVNYL
jgi:hypothetical protein